MSGHSGGHLSQLNRPFIYAQINHCYGEASIKLEADYDNNKVKITPLSVNGTLPSTTYVITPDKDALNDFDDIKNLMGIAIVQE